MSVTPPRPKGPPLNAMRAFEAAARLSSIVGAAEELGVTPGAVSQHVKTLEEWAGVALFRRHAQGVALTAAGAGLVRPFTDAFDAVAQATHALRDQRPEREVHIAALPSVAQLWLPRRLAQVRAAFPNVKISVTALEKPPSLSRELFDLSLFFGAPPLEPDQIAVIPDVIAPVAAPGLAEQLAQKGDLCAAERLVDRSWAEDWALWLAKTQIQIGEERRAAQYSLYSLAVEEAKSGAGVLMGHLCLLEDAMGTGALVRVSGEAVETGRALLLSLPHKHRRQKHVDDVVEALLSVAPAGGSQARP